MRASNLVTAMMALVVSTAGFIAIDYLFTHSSGWHEAQADEAVQRL